MIALCRSAILAWYVTGSLLIRCCCCWCYSFGKGDRAVSSTLSRASSTTITNNQGWECVQRRRDRRPWSAQKGREGESVGQTRAESGKEDTGEEVGAALVLSRSWTEVVLPPNRGLRVHSMSDLHTDSKANAAWVKTWASWKGYDPGQLGEAHEDVLIVAGDISSSLERISETLTDLKERYDEVFFVVGNHEMWTGRRKPKAVGDIGGGGGSRGKLERGIDSVEKLVRVHRMCESLGVRTDPVIFTVGGGNVQSGKAGMPLETGEGLMGEGGPPEEGRVMGRQELAVFPLLSWYHASWDDEPNLPPELQLRRGDFLRRWRDFSCCHWPEDLCSRGDFVTVDGGAPPVIAEFFARQNDACIETFRAKGKGGGSRTGAAGAPRSGNRGRAVREGGFDDVAFESSLPSSIKGIGGDGVGGGGGSGGGGGGGSGTSIKVISFSHFVPRQELCPEKRLLWEPQLTKVIGSNPLERQIRELGSDVHIFGHTHIPIDMTSAGVRYVQWPLGSVREQSYRTNDMREKGPLLVYSHDGREGGLRPPVHTLWGEFYENYARDPYDTHIPENTYEYMKQRLAEGRRRAKDKQELASTASLSEQEKLSTRVGSDT